MLTVNLSLLNLDLRYDHVWEMMEKLQAISNSALDAEVKTAYQF
jgi:hypothetical protein